MCKYLIVLRHRYFVTEPLSLKAAVRRAFSSGKAGETVTVQELESGKPVVTFTRFW